MMRTPGLRLQDTPPLTIPLSFFLTAPLAICAAGFVLLSSGAEALSGRWSPLTLALTHLGTLGLLTMVMLGALYQLLAVVVGSPVPWLRAAHAVHALFVVGVASLCWGIAHLDPTLVRTGIYTLGPAILLFLGPVAVALARARKLDATTFGIAAAVTCFFLAATAGLWMAHGFGGMRFPGPRDLWVQAHLTIAVVGWVGGLISAVSWQVIPMFYLAREAPTRLEWPIQATIAVSASLPLGLVALHRAALVSWSPPQLSAVMAAAALPAFVCAFLVHPAITLRSLQARRRRRADGSLLFWRAGLAAAPCVLACALAARFLPTGPWELLFGWLALWGWAGMIMHGMLTRIVPFLVWLHRFASRVGRVPVPSVKKILPDRWTRIGFVLHLLSVLTGVLAIASGSDLATRATGVLVVGTGGWLMRSLLHVARQGVQPHEAEERKVPASD